MRKQTLPWIILVIAILASTYGLFLFVRELIMNQKVFIGALTAFLIGMGLLLFYLITYIHSNRTKGNKGKPEEDKKEQEVIEPVEKQEDAAPQINIEVEKEEEASHENVVRRPNVASDYPSSYTTRTPSVSGYVKEVGRGPIFEINGNQLRDMRSNTYYSLNGNYVYRQGSGMIYRIEGNRIISLNGTPLFELSGSNIHKVFGGYYASIRGDYITKHDLSEKYEMTSSFAPNMMLLIGALLFARS